VSRNAAVRVIELPGGYAAVGERRLGVELAVETDHRFDQRGGGRAVGQVGSALRPRAPPEVQRDQGGLDYEGDEQRRHQQGEGGAGGGAPARILRPPAAVARNQTIGAALEPGPQPRDPPAECHKDDQVEHPEGGHPQRGHVDRQHPPGPAPERFGRLEVTEQGHGA